MIHTWQTKRGLIAAIMLSGLFLVPATRATVYEVGPGQALSGVGQVPWESLMAGDEVRIHWRAEAYQEKFVLCRQGTAQAPIRVIGVPGPGGQLPVLDGRDATTRAALNFWGENRGVLKIGGSNTPADTMPAWLVIENLHIRSARPPFSFTGRDGLTDYNRNAAAVYIEKGEHIVLRNLKISDSGNGLFCGAETSDLLVEGCAIHDNGIEGSIYEHNNYTEALGAVFQFNHFGPLRDGCPGNNLKDRSAGLVVRYNWIEGGNRQLDLVDAEDSDVLVADPSYRRTFVYGNVLIEPDGAGNSQIVHYGGDSGDESIYRKGTLHFYNNTVISTRSDNTTLLRLSSNDETADCRNNIVYLSGAGDRLALLDESGRLTLRHNWLKPDYRACHGVLAGTLDDDGSSLTGDQPGFVDLAGGDFHLSAGAEPLDQGLALHADVLPDHALLYQYLRHQQWEERPLNGPLDLGAFERCASGDCGPADGGPDGLADGDDDGAVDGQADGAADGESDGAADGEPDGGLDGSADAGDGGADADPDGDDSKPADGDAGGNLSGGCGCSSGAGPVDGLGLLVLVLMLLFCFRFRRGG